MVKRSLFILSALLALLSLNANASWTKPKNISSNPGAAYQAVIAVDSRNNIHVVWSDSTPGNIEILYTRSTDGGQTWTKAKNLSSNSGISSVPDIAVDSRNNIHVVWHNETSKNSSLFNIYFRKSANGGSTWTATSVLSSKTVYSSEPHIAIAPSDKSLHVVWSQLLGQAPGLCYKRSKDSGKTWFPSIILGSYPGFYGAGADIAADLRSSVYVFAHDRTDGYNRLAFKKSMDLGKHWTNPKCITPNSGNPGSKNIAIDSQGTIHMTWQENTVQKAEAYYKKSIDGGATWTISKNLSQNTGWSFIPAIAADLSGNIHVVWYDTTPGNQDIFYRKSKNGGANWLESERLTSTTKSSWLPAVATDSLGQVHVVWVEGPMGGSSEIFYMKGN